MRADARSSRCNSVIVDGLEIRMDWNGSDVSGFRQVQRRVMQRDGTTPPGSASRLSSHADLRPDPEGMQQSF